MIAFVWASRERRDEMRELMREQQNIRHFAYGDPPPRGVRFQAAILMEPHNLGTASQTVANIQWVLDCLETRMLAGVKVIDGIEDDY